jgi:hypothetical protein
MLNNWYNTIDGEKAWPLYVLTAEVDAQYSKRSVKVKKMITEAIIHVFIDSNDLVVSNNK